MTPEEVSEWAAEVIRAAKERYPEPKYSHFAKGSGDQWQVRFRVERSFIGEQSGQYWIEETVALVFVHDPLSPHCLDATEIGYCLAWDAWDVHRSNRARKLPEIKDRPPYEEP